MLSFVLNGQPVSIPDPEPETTLLEFLRNRGLTGSKEGCAEGECGACAVALVSDYAEPTRDRATRRSAFRAVNSCLMLLPMVGGREVYTVESLASNGVLADAQRAMAEAGGSQCGYCTPGFVVSLFAEQYRPDRTGPCDTRALGGNLCRCTGYRPIRDAARSLGPAPQDAFSARLAQPAPPVAAMACEGFIRPDSVEECVHLLTQHPDARPVAGGTDLGAELNLRGRRPRLLVSLEGIDELRAFSATPDTVRIGAALPLTDIAACWVHAPDVWHTWSDLFASPLIRNRATLGGNLGTASPIGDAAPLLLALDARVEMAGVSGRRTVPLAEFFRGYRKTALAPGEIITSIKVPLPLPGRVSFYKIAKRPLDDISTVAASFALTVDPEGVATYARFCFGGVAAVPLRSVDAEQAVVGRLWNETSVARVQGILDHTLEPLSDHRGSATFRREVAKSLVQKFWYEAQA